MNAHSYRSKRLVDLLVLAVGCVPAAIVGATAAIWIKATSEGPVLFRQTRVGRNGTEFECLKFRTMLHGKNPLIPSADRITSAGKWLRRFSLDEFPQLINVARGEMSIVGPRPMLPFQAARCDDRQALRFSVRPGLTGSAQISGRNSLTWPERIELDIDYVKRQSPILDLTIVVGTAGALISGTGVSGHDASDPFVTNPDDQHA